MVKAACTTEIRQSTAENVCAKAGNLPRCQLCPNSPTYWRNTTRPAAADPWDGTQKPGFVRAPEAAQVDWTGAIDAGAGQKPIGPQRLIWRNGPTMPCRICAKPTTMWSPKNQPAHKVCAERWNREHRTPPATGQL